MATSSALRTWRLLAQGCWLSGLLWIGAGCQSLPPSPQVMLFNGFNLAGWRQPAGGWQVVGGVPLASQNSKRFELQTGAGVLVNGASGRTVNLISERELGDIEAHFEFVVPEESNSGVYFQGRYEIQIMDSWRRRPPKYSDCGGIYERWRQGQGFEGRPPRFNASLPPGDWQSFDVVFRAPRFDETGKKIANARFVKVIHNGVVIHENVEVTGPTRSALDEVEEKPRGPIMLQGDHGPVAYRNLWVKPIFIP